MVGNTGAGKSTVARALAERLEAPWVELDAIFHQEHWQPIELTEFRARVCAVVAGDAWVVDGRYSAVADLVRARADTIVWVDLPRSTVMRQLIGRSLRRVVRREVLWNGNRERWRDLIRRDPQKSVLAYAWKNHNANTRRFEVIAAETAATTNTSFVRLHSRADIDRFLGAGRPGSPPRPERRTDA